jgi:arylsulfatase A-like enzyme
MIGELEKAVARICQENNTYFIFSSDNGYHLGEHRLMPGKMTAFDSDIHVPLVITGPKIPSGLKVEEIVENIDFNPTITDLTKIEPMPGVEGRSLVPLSSRVRNGKKSSDWRTAALIEHRGPRREPLDPDAPGIRSGNPPSYEALRTRTTVYVEYVNGDREYHDLASDPWELHNVFSSLNQRERNNLHQGLSALASCHTAESCWNAQHFKLTLP